jgi:hypothetical protein
MLMLEILFVALPAITGGLALLGYAGLIWQRRKAQQAKARVKPIPVTSRRRHETRRLDTQG